MSLFTTPANSTPSIRNVPPAPETPLDRYNANLKQLHAIEIEFAEAFRAVAAHCAAHKDGRAGFVGGELYARVNAMQHDPVLQSLESKLREVSRRRAALLQQHAILKLAAGLTK